MFYAYKGNKPYDYDGNPGTPVETYSSPDGNFSHDFVEIISSNAEGLTRLDNFYPGKAYTFALRVDQKTSAKLQIARLLSNDTQMEGRSERRYITSSETQINIGWAVNIYATLISATHNVAPSYNTNILTAPQTNMRDEGVGDKFLYTESNRATYLAGSVTNNVVTLTNKIPLLDKTGLNVETDSYLFYSVYFSNEESTYYQQSSVNGNNKYYTKTTVGDSNCYANLSFALTELSLELN